MLKKSVLMCLALSFSLTLLAQGDPAAGKASYTICVACHGPDGAGNKALNSPAIAGQEAWYVARQLKNFKDGVRGTDPKDVWGATMRPMAMTLTTDKMVEDVSAYVASLKPVDVVHDGGGDAAKGKVAYSTICATCHGPDGHGIKAMNSPKVYLQQDWYLVRQLQNFKAGIRGANPKDIYGQQMRPMAMTLADDQAVKDVVAYMITLK